MTVISRAHHMRIPPPFPNATLSEKIDWVLREKKRIKEEEENNYLSKYDLLDFN
jgi:hypothetical protein